MYELVTLDRMIPLVDPHTGTPRVFPTGEEARAFAKCLKDSGVGKYRPRKVGVDADWEAREAQRFLDGTYRAPTWVNSDTWKVHMVRERPHQILTKHYVHVSKDDPRYVAYTADDRRGQADIQTKMGAGAYLQKFYGHIFSQMTIARLVVQYDLENAPNAYELKYARTADEVEHVYREGPGSCMARDGQSSGHVFLSQAHPTRVYGDSDLCVAYLESEGRITARAVVNEARKEYVRIYGDEARMSHFLMKAGFSRSASAYNDARIRKIEDRMGYCLMPYIDGSYQAKEDGDFLILHENKGAIPTQPTCGLVNVAARDWANVDECLNCGNWYLVDRSLSDDDDRRRYCSDACANED